MRFTQMMESCILFFVLEYYRDTISPDHQGVYSIRGIHDSNMDGNWGAMEEMRVPGIYVPEGWQREVPIPENKVKPGQ